MNAGVISKCFIFVAHCPLTRIYRLVGTNGTFPLNGNISIARAHHEQLVCHHSGMVLMKYKKIISDFPIINTSVFKTVTIVSLIPQVTRGRDSDDSVSFAPEGYELMWEDNFDGAEINTNNWVIAR